jgi:hypothetical protein
MPSDSASAQPVVVEPRDDEQHEISAGRAGLDDLVLGGDEVLAQHRDVDPGAHGPQVVERAVEPGALGEHADHRRAVLGVDGGERRRVGDLGERAARRAGTLHLGDDVDGVTRGQRGEHVTGGRLRRRLLAHVPDRLDGLAGGSVRERRLIEAVEDAHAGAQCRGLGVNFGPCTP